MVALAFCLRVRVGAAAGRSGDAAADVQVDQGAVVLGLRLADCGLVSCPAYYRLEGDKGTPKPEAP